MEPSFTVKSKGALHSLSSKLAMPIPTNMVGLYELEDIIIEPCSIRLTPLTKPAFLVENELDKVDIYPPVLTQFRFEPATAQPGDKVRLVFKGEDKSPICTREREEEGRCQAKRHQTIASLDGKRILPFGEALEATGDGEYAFTLSIPKEAEAGAYKLYQVFVKDIVDNMTAEPSGVPAILTIEKKSF